jgi:hypothetical protein
MRPSHFGKPPSSVFVAHRGSQMCARSKCRNSGSLCVVATVAKQALQIDSNLPCQVFLCGKLVESEVIAPLPLPGVCTMMRRPAQIVCAELHRYANIFALRKRPAAGDQTAGVKDIVRVGRLPRVRLRDCAILLNSGRLTPAVPCGRRRASVRRSHLMPAMMDRIAPPVCAILATQ